MYRENRISVRKSNARHYLRLSSIQGSRRERPRTAIERICGRSMRMRLVTPVLKRVVYPGLARSGYLRRHAPAGVAVVTYHGLVPRGYSLIDPALDGSLITAEMFQSQLQLVKRKYNVITPEQFLRWMEGQEDVPPRAVLLTCDDGLQNTLEMLPILADE